jgi:hypothetical protein
MVDDACTWFYKCSTKGSKIDVHPIGWPQKRKMGLMCSWALGHASESIMIFRVARAPTSIIMA